MILVLAVPWLAACDDSDDFDCSGSQVQKRLEVETPSDPAMEFKIASCKVDVDACPALCTLALERIGIGAFGVTTCTVGFAGDTVLMDVDYTVSNPNCFFGDDFSQPTGGGF
ncbi:MAG: hypothetical protein H0V17_16400 [Deltaproteobacteria bacterium]|nr:hypothetical protein [Deltaproteobacteria bacterium]